VRAWLRRNRWGLVALAVIVPGALAAAASVSWFGYYAEKAPTWTVVPPGEAGTFVPERPQPEGGSAAPAPPASLTLTDYTIVPWDSEVGRDIGLLEGTEAVSALIDVDAGGMPDDAFRCDAQLVADGRSGERTWNVSSGSDIDYYPSGELEASCGLPDGGRFTWEAVFVVPEGVAEDARLYITRGAFLPERVLLLEH
jgi:hypothetical protein